MADATDKVVHPEHKRKLTALEKFGLAVGGGSSVLGALTVYGAIKNHFWTREEGDAVKAALATVEKQMVLNNQEQMRVVERKVDKILDFLKEDRETARASIDRIDRRLDNLDLIVLTKPKGGK